MFQRALYWTGAGSMYVKACKVSGTVILMYHSVADPRDQRWIDPQNRIPLNMFRAQMRFLARHRNVVPMDRLVDSVGSGTSLPAGSVVLTFDDGYIDNLHIASPILRAYGHPAVLYLPTGYIDRCETQWIDQLYTIFNSRQRHELTLDMPTQLRFDVRDSRDCASAYSAFAGLLLTALRHEREQLLAELTHQLRPALSPPRLTLTWEEVRQLARENPLLTFGAHTVDHIDLSTHDEQVARDELSGSMLALSREVGGPVRYLSFPYGRCSDHARQIAQQLGFCSAVASGVDCLIGGKADRMALPRISPPESFTLFRFQTSGAYPRLPRALTGRA